MRRAVLGLCLAIGVGTASGHTQESTRPASPADNGTFEVVTLKQNKSGEPAGWFRRLPGGRVTLTNVAARSLITFAYDIHGYQLIGGPAWLASDKFDLTAKMEGNPDWGGIGTGRPDPISLAMRKLLVERFKLKLHMESRQFDAFALVLAKPHVTGPALKPSPSDCKALIEQEQRGQAQPRKAVNGIVPCARTGSVGRLFFDGFPMGQAAIMLMNPAGRPVVDRTGLTGNWQFLLTFAQEPPANVSPDANNPASDPNTPNFFTAIQEQLGLKLESTKATFDVTVVDAAERPSED